MMKHAWSWILLLGMLTGCELDALPEAGEVTSSERGAPMTDGQPTEEEVKATIKRLYDEVYMQADGNAIPERVEYAFGDIQVGALTQKAIDFTMEPREVYPIKTVVDITVHFSNNPKPRSWVRGKESNQVYFFYRDEFGEWNFKQGSL